MECPYCKEEIKNNAISMFRASFSKYNVILNKNEALFIIKNTSLESVADNLDGIYHPIRIKYLNTSSNLKIIGKQKLLGTPEAAYNGKDINLFEKILYSEIYPGIDIIYYGSKNDLTFDFVLKQGSNIDDVLFEFDGVERLSLDEKNNLIIHYKNKVVKQVSPKIYKLINGQNEEVKGNIIIKNINQIGFIVKE